MKASLDGKPVEQFPNVTPLEELAKSRVIQVDTPDTAAPADAAEQGLTYSPGTPTPKSVKAQEPPKPAPAQSQPPGAPQKSTSLVSPTSVRGAQ